MSNFPDFASMLPRQARQALEDYFFKKISDQGIFTSLRPRYGLVEALHETRDINEYVRREVGPIYDKALKRWEKENPLQWDNSCSKSYREVAGKKRYFNE